jgi:two-component system, cell cycle response regulator DivK
MTKILIAEDNATNRELFRELLEARGYAVDEACNGPEALRMLEQAQPDLLLLDIGMPVLDGFAVVRAIRKNPRLAALPVLAVTAYAMQGDRERILNSGFDGYLSKPINAKLLVKELDRLLHKGKERNATARPSEGESTEGDSISKKRAATAAGNNSSDRD